MRIYKSFQIILIVLMILCSCAKGGVELNDKISPPDKSITVLSSKKYDEKQLAELAKFKGSLAELDASFPIECMRESGGMYRISYLGEEKIAVLLFDSSDTCVLGNIYSVHLKKDDFSGLSKGQTIDDVKAVDPDGDYLFLYTGRNDSPRVSTHFTQDGFMITIEYDTSYAIVKIIEELV